MRPGLNGTILSACILISLVLLSTPVHADAGQSKINVSIYVYNIRGFDVSTGQYDVDFYLHFKWNADETPQNVSDQVRLT